MSTLAQDLDALETLAQMYGYDMGRPMSLVAKIDLDRPERIGRAIDRLKAKILRTVTTNGAVMFDAHRNPIGVLRGETVCKSSQELQDETARLEKIRMDDAALIFSLHCENEALRQRMVCHWTYDGSSDSWDTECGNKYVFAVDGPKENGQEFCGYCGGVLDQRLDGDK